MIFNGEIIEFPRTEEIENPYLRLAIDTFPLCIRFKLFVHDEISNTLYDVENLNDLVYEYSIRDISIDELAENIKFIFEFGVTINKSEFKRLSDLFDNLIQFNKESNKSFNPEFESLQFPYLENSFIKKIFYDIIGCEIEEYVNDNFPLMEYDRFFDQQYIDEFIETSERELEKIFDIFSDNEATVMKLLLTFYTLIAQAMSTEEIASAEIEYYKMEEKPFCVLPLLDKTYIYFPLGIKYN